MRPGWGAGKAWRGEGVRSVPPPLRGGNVFGRGAFRWRCPRLTECLGLPLPAGEGRGEGENVRGLAMCERGETFQLFSLTSFLSRWERRPDDVRSLKSKQRFLIRDSSPRLLRSEARPADSSKSSEWPAAVHPAAAPCSRSRRRLFAAPLAAGLPRSPCR